MPKYKVDVQPGIVKKPLTEHPLRVAAYCRVSTGSDEQFGSLENQIEFYTKSIFKQFSSLNGYSPGFIQTTPPVSA